MRLDKGILCVLLALLLLPLVAAGQEVSIAGKTEFAPYKFAEFQAIAPDKWGCTWEFPSEIDVRELSDDGRKILAVGPPGEYTAVLFVAGLTGDKSDPTVVFKRARKTFTIGKAPDPGPGPGPKPDPDTPAPIPDAGFRVMIVYESGDLTKYPTETGVILNGEEVRNFLNKNCADEGNGHPAWRIYDANDDISKDYPVWQKAMTRERKDLPWVIVSNGKTGFEGPLPKTHTAFIDLCKQYLPK